MHSLERSTLARRLITVPLVAMMAVVMFALATQPVAASDHAEITSPEDGATIVIPLGDDSVTVSLEASYDDDSGNMQWALRYDNAGCARGDDNENNLYGNVDGMDDPFSWDGREFSAEVELGEGEYCFVVNPTAGDRLVVSFTVVEADAPESKADCMGGGYADYGFRNQGLCIASLVANERASQRRPAKVSTKR